MNFQLITLIKIAGWILALAPLVGFVAFSVYMVKEIAKNDDESLKGLVHIGLVFFWIGVVLLVVGYGGPLVLPSAQVG